jgi:hypothetical protein
VAATELPVVQPDGATKLNATGVDVVAVPPESGVTLNQVGSAVVVSTVNGVPSGEMEETFSVTAGPGA